jgi:hypothetical protein
MAGAKDTAELLMMQMNATQANTSQKLKEKQEKDEARRRTMQSLGAFGIANAASMRSALAWFGPSSGDLPTNFTTAARWESFNPWAKIAEFVSTHPLTAHRIKALQALNKRWEKPNEFDFSKVQPGKYHGFLRDVLVLLLPWIGAAIGLAASMTAFRNGPIGAQIGLPLAGFFGLGLLGLLFRYKVETASRYKVLSLLGALDVSHVAPKYVVLEGTFTGLLGAGFIWANDYILQDETGYLACLYQQPFAILEWIHGYLYAKEHLGRPVRVYGWYRRFNAPYVEIDRIEFLDSRSTTKCYFLLWNICWHVLALAGAAALIGLVK